MIKTQKKKMWQQGDLYEVLTQRRELLKVMGPLLWTELLHLATQTKPKESFVLKFHVAKLKLSHWSDLLTNQEGKKNTIIKFMNRPVLTGMIKTKVPDAFTL
jgi:hypothetical protein